MTFGEAMYALAEGKKVRNITWDPQNYIYLKNSRVYKQGDVPRTEPINVETGLKYKWELYEEPKKDVKVYIHVYTSLIDEIEVSLPTTLDWENFAIEEHIDDYEALIKTITLGDTDND